MAFLQEPISDEEEELDIENVHKDMNKLDLPILEGEHERLFYEGKGKDEENGNVKVFIKIVIFKEYSILNITDHCEQVYMFIRRL